MLAMTGRQRMVMTATISSAIVAVVANLLLVPEFGILGAAVATAAALIVSNSLSLFFVRRYLGFWPYGRRYVKPLISGAVACTVVYLTRLALPDYQGLQALVIFTPLFVAVFAATLATLGLSPSDKQFLSSFWTAVHRSLKWNVKV